MKDKIMKLNNYETFYEDVKQLIGYYDSKEYADYEIKELQRIADYRYSQLKEMFNIALNNL